MGHVLELGHQLRERPLDGHAAKSFDQGAEFLLRRQPSNEEHRFSLTGDPHGFPHQRALPVRKRRKLAGPDGIRHPQEFPGIQAALATLLAHRVVQYHDSRRPLRKQPKLQSANDALPKRAYSVAAREFHDNGLPKQPREHTAGNNVRARHQKIDQIVFIPLPPKPPCRSHGKDVSAQPDVCAVSELAHRHARIVDAHGFGRHLWTARAKDLRTVPAKNQRRTNALRLDFGSTQNR